MKNVGKNVLIVGNSCHDTLILPSGERVETLGGSVSYISAVLSFLGVEFDSVSKVGRDFKYMDQLDVTPRVCSGKTTHFIADFSLGDRVLRLGAVCDVIRADEVPQGMPFQVALAVGIAGEILPETIERMADASRYLVCDAQGLIRVIDKHGQVGYQPLAETQYYPLLKRISFLKASEEEARYLSINDVRKETCLLITRGDKGCSVYLEMDEFHIPAYTAQEIESTGAGDCFLAGFAAGLIQGFTIPHSVQLGNRFGALAVESIGVPDFKNLTKEELLVFQKSL